MTEQNSTVPAGSDAEDRPAENLAAQGGADQPRDAVGPAETDAASTGDDAVDGDGTSAGVDVGQEEGAGDPGATSGAEAAGSSVPDRRTAAQRLEEEGDVAADYLEELLDIVDLDGDIDIDVENGRASVSVVADAVSTRSLRRLAGPEGEVLEALQELTRLAVQTRTGERSRLMLDVAGFRAARRRDLEALAGRAVTECRRTAAPVRLDPMTPFERKVVHDAIASAGLRSESEGEEPQRRVVVLPAGS